MKTAICRSCIVLIFLFAAAATVVAQARMQANPLPRIHSSLIEADELFVLNIKERRISERDFEASTAVAIGGDEKKGVSVQAGVSLQAQSIEVLLRNVSGSVRFRASLQRLLDVVNSHPR